MSELNNHVRKAMGGVLRWLGAVLGALLVALVGWEAKTISELNQKVQRQEIQISQNKNVGDTNSGWIKDWYSKLKVPERDQRQDDGLAEARRQIEEMRSRLRELEKKYAGLGGTKDPLFGLLQALEKRIRALEAKVK